MFQDSVLDLIILLWKLLLGNLQRGENFNWKVMWRCYFHAISLLWPLMTFSAYIAAKPLLLRLFTVLLKWKRKRKNILHTSYIAQGFFNLNLLKFGPVFSLSSQLELNISLKERKTILRSFFFKVDLFWDSIFLSLKTKKHLEVSSRLFLFQSLLF